MRHIHTRSIYLDVCNAVVFLSILHNFIRQQYEKETKREKTESAHTQAHITFSFFSVFIKATVLAFV